MSEMSLANRSDRASYLAKLLAEDADAPLLRQPHRRKPPRNYNGSKSILESVREAHTIAGIDRALVMIRSLKGMSAQTLRKIEHAAEERKGELRAAALIL